uniref:Potassium channel n=1 Tax=Solanum tuberosum TaxID=4113 RepID=M1BW39_SOLTU
MIFVVSEDNVEVAQEFAKQNQLSPRIQDQILSHICLKFKTESLQQKETMNVLPKAIRSSVALYLFLPIVQNVSLFRGVSRDLLFQLVPEMEAEYYPPKEDVILQNESQTYFYIIVSGALYLLVDIDGCEQIIGKAVVRESFGEIGVLLGRPQQYAVRTTKISQILCLSRKPFLNILRDNQEDERIKMRNLVQKTLFLGRVASPLLAEIIGVYEALSWLKERFSRTRLVVETDNLLVKQALEENLVNYSYFDSLVFDCKTLIQELPFLSLSAVKKLTNQVAHCLASASVSMSGSLEWDTNPPSLITDVLIFDMNNT